QNAEYGFADLKVDVARSTSGDNTRKIASEHEGSRVLSRRLCVLGCALPHLHIGSIYAGGMDIDDDLALPSDRVRHIAETQRVDTTISVDENGLHVRRSPYVRQSQTTRLVSANSNRE